ncbi:MAG: Rieske 2Fe-2S domain-containing protein [Chloroflexi bacterium]|nr:Rieske 2Fe-2S domain-containing protein [Chloroflexota bacterium]
MLSKEDNEYITRIGPGTPMGNLFRQYWLPAGLSSELPQPDSDPTRIMLLGEKLIMFRDTNGQVGLIQNHCPHRGASLFFGRNEEAGLRCVYHGWKFDVTGQCIDMPNEPAESNFKTKVKATAYPCRERGGIIWAYMGPRSTPPELPDFEANTLEGCQVFAAMRDSNWLQALEGDIDTCHTAILHSGSITPEETPDWAFAHFMVKDRAPRYAVMDTSVGATYTAYCNAQPGHRFYRLGQYYFPCYTSPAPGLLGYERRCTMWVPLDDENVMVYNLNAPRVEPGQSPPARLRPNLLPNTTDWLGRFRMPNQPDNDYLIDRAVQRANKGPNGYTGIAGVGQQDAAMQGSGSMGAIYDRTQERLGTSDTMIIRVRRRLIAAARALADKGTVPPGVDNPEDYQLRSGGVILKEGEDWMEATRELVKAYKDHAGLDLRNNAQGYARALGRSQATATPQSR